MAIKAIETSYRGYKFRSRLEARYAVLFDALDVRWEYEKEGYDLDGVYYLPDFWLPNYSLWAEVKPGPFSPSEKNKAMSLFRATHHDVIMLVGTPDAKLYESITGNGYGLFPYKNSIFDTYKIQLDYADLPFVKWPRGYSQQFNEFAATMTKEAVTIARSARFEHGESPRVA